MGKRSISKEALGEQLRLNPNVTHAQLKIIFSCGSSTIQRELARHGLATKKSSEREYTWLQGDQHPWRKWHKEHPEFGANQRGDRNPIHKVKQLYQDPSYVTKITSGIREHVKGKKGKTYEETYGEEKAAQYRERLRAASPARMSKFKRKVTKPEQIVRDTLISFGVTFKEQHPVGYCTVDFFVENAGLIIQADGDYWHGNPEVYSSLSPLQSKRRRLDAASDSYAISCGFKVLRLWEKDLYTRIDWCRAEIRKALDQV